MRSRTTSTSTAGSRPTSGSRAGKAASSRGRRRPIQPEPGDKQSEPAGTIEEQLIAIEEEGGDGTLVFPDGGELRVTSLGKEFFPERAWTKGDVMRYYTRAAEVVLPPITDRPLALRRYPDGIHGESFFQHRPASKVPPGVRVGDVRKTSRAPKDLRFTGGDLITLLYTVQLGSISLDGWHSRIQSLDEPDYLVLDLDPSPGADFARVVHVARLLRDQLKSYRLGAGFKTSGSRGLHAFVPLPAGATYEVSAPAAELIATRVATANPEVATVQRRVSARPRGSVYVDYQQNARGKTIAMPFALRPKPGGTISAPLVPDELDEELDPGAFTLLMPITELQRRGKAWLRALSVSNTLDRLTPE